MNFDYLLLSFYVCSYKTRDILLNIHLLFR